MMLSAVRRRDPEATAIEEVDYVRRRVTYACGGRTFAREFDAVLRKGGNTELEIGAERLPDDPPDGYKIAVAELRRGRAAEPPADLRTGESVYAEPPNPYEIALAANRQGGR
jgi:hypothetical protein